MIVSDVIDRVRRTAGDVDVLQFTDDDIINWINDATKECASDNQLLQKSATSTVIEGQTDYDLPLDILKLHSVRYDNNKIRMMTMQEFDHEISGFGSGDTGGPVLGYVWAGKLVLYPAPDNSTKSLVVSYTRTPTEVTAPADAIDLPTMYHRRLVDYCLAMVAELDDDMQRYQTKMDEFKSGVQNLKDQDEWNQDLYPHISVSDRDMGTMGEYWYE